MRRFHDGYGGYRGRRTINDILKFIAMGLAGLVVLVLIALFLGQDYIVYTDMGLRLELPFSREKPGETADPSDSNMAVQPPSFQPEEPVELPEKEQPAMAALELPVVSVVDGSAARKLEQAKANALILNMKDEEGRLAWASRQEMAAQGGVNAQESGINEVLRGWNQGEVYTVARVCCFRDNAIPYQHKNMALRASYGNWRDELGLRWLNPDSADARTYLAGLCGELAELGFDEILLEYCAFPTQGKLTDVVKSGSYAVGQFAQTTERFLNEVNQALEPYGTVLSVYTDRTVLTGEDTRSGLTAAGLENCCGRLWMAEDETQPALTALLSSAGITESEKRLVVVANSLGGQSKNALAVFDGA